MALMALISSPLSGWQFDLVDLMAKIVGIRSSSFCLLIYGPTHLIIKRGKGHRGVIW
jgi:hypothetical protein